MSIHPLGAPNASTTVSGPRGAPGAAAEPNTADAVPQGSSSVTLSPGARVLARFAERGLAMTLHSLQAPLGKNSAATEAPREQAEAFVPVGRAQLEELFTQMGASPEEVKTLVQGFDADVNGELSQDELLGGLARSARDGASAFSQTLMRVMDRLDQADGTVSQREFATVETNLTEAGKR